MKKGYRKDYEALAVFFADAIERGRTGVFIVKALKFSKMTLPVPLGW